MRTDFTLLLRFVPRLLSLVPWQLSMEQSVQLTHHRGRDVQNSFGEGKFMRARNTVALTITLLLPLILPAQVTHGQKPKLPPPFATESAGNGPERVRPPASLLPTVPQGFRVNIFAKEFKRPRWLTAAPNGDIFLADTCAGEIIVLRDP